MNGLLTWLVTWFNLLVMCVGYFIVTVFVYQNLKEAYSRWRSAPVKTRYERMMYFGYIAFFGVFGLLIGYSLYARIST